jgi:hypothetical protein
VNERLASGSGIGDANDQEWVTTNSGRMLQLTRSHTNFRGSVDDQLEDVGP